MTTSSHWTFSSNAFWGESLTGEWQLSLSDQFVFDQGTFEAFEFTAHTAVVPEPASAVALACGGLLLMGRRRHRHGAVPAAKR